MPERPSPGPIHESGQELATTKDMETLASPAEGLPSAKQITDTIAQGDNNLRNETKSRKTIEKQVEWHDRKVKELAEYHSASEREVRALQEHDPLGDIAPADYDSLIANNFITKDYADALKALDQKIIELDTPDAPTEAQRLELIKYLELKNHIGDRLYSDIFARSREIEERRTLAVDKTLARYREHTQKLNEIIKNISERPGVAEILDERALQELELENKKNEAENLRDFEKEFLGGMDSELRLVTEKNNRGFARLEEITGEKNLDQTFATFDSLDEEKQNILINKLRDKLFDAILEGEGQAQLRSPREVVPWHMHRPVDLTTYWQAMDFLTGQEMKQALPGWKESGAPTAEIEKKLATVKSQGQAFRRLFGRERIIDAKTKRPKPGSFWAAFETRKSEDASGVTEQRKKNRQELAALYEKEGPMQRVIAFSGGNGFALVERVAGKKGEYEHITQILGTAPPGLKEGMVSRDFPQWLTRIVSQAFR